MLPCCAMPVELQRVAHQGWPSVYQKAYFLIDVIHVLIRYSLQRLRGISHCDSK